MHSSAKELTTLHTGLQRRQSNKSSTNRSPHTPAGSHRSSSADRGRAGRRMSLCNRNSLWHGTGVIQSGGYINSLVGNLRSAKCGAGPVDIAVRGSSLEASCFSSPGQGARDGGFAGRVGSGVLDGGRSFSHRQVWCQCALWRCRGAGEDVGCCVGQCIVTGYRGQRCAGDCLKWNLHVCVSEWQPQTTGFDAWQPPYP